MSESCGDCCAPKNLTQATPAYRRALWIVVALNVGMGVAEMIGGFLAGSQALKADALDFFGDGVITLFGLLAIGWSLTWRARAALTQGVFLGVMGVGVFVTTAYRATRVTTSFTPVRTEADLTGPPAYRTRLRGHPPDD